SNEKPALLPLIVVAAANTPFLHGKAPNYIEQDHSFNNISGKLIAPDQLSRTFNQKPVRAPVLQRGEPPSAICRSRATRSPLIRTVPASISCWPVQSYFS